MSVLINQSKNIQLVPHLEKANSFFQRAKGLLGKSHIGHDYALLIYKCNSVHTFFMKFPIDIIFVNQQFIVESIIVNLRPGRVTLPRLKYKHVIEFKAHTLNQSNAEIGDQLYVGD